MYVNLLKVWNAKNDDDWNVGTNKQITELFEPWILASPYLITCSLETLNLANSESKFQPIFKETESSEIKITNFESDEKHTKEQ